MVDGLVAMELGHHESEVPGNMRSFVLLSVSFLSPLFFLLFLFSLSSWFLDPCSVSLSFLSLHPLSTSLFPSLLPPPSPLSSLFFSILHLLPVAHVNRKLEQFQTRLYPGT